MCGFVFGGFVRFFLPGMLVLCVVVFVVVWFGLWSCGVFVCFGVLVLAVLCVVFVCSSSLGFVCSVRGCVWVRRCLVVCVFRVWRFSSFGFRVWVLFFLYFGLLVVCVCVFFECVCLVCVCVLCVCVCVLCVCA